MILIQSGDHRAFSVLYDRYAHRLNAFFFRMLWSDKRMAEDYVHDLFSKIIDRPQVFQEGYQFKPWVFQVAANMCKNGYRKRSFEQEYLDQLQVDVGVESSIERRIDEGLLNDQVQKILDGMEEERRTMFVLRYQQEMKIDEIASIFNIPVGTVKTRLFHTRAKIFKTLTEEDEG